VNLRILVADDFAPWRRFISSIILLKEPGWHIVCEVSDGAEAVVKAEVLAPDLILLDLSLPKLNGIEAARQIRKVAPNCKILFLSAFDAIEVVEEALNAGGNGYIAKLDAARELIEAVETLFQGKQFVSSRIKGGIVADVEDTQASDKTTRDEVFWSQSHHAQEAKFTRCHEVQFYSDDEDFLESVTHFIVAALKFGNAAIVVATKPHRDMLLGALKAQDVDIDSLIQQGAYVSCDAADALSTFMIDDWPDVGRFLEAFNKLIDSALRAAKAKHPRVAIFGEGVALLWAEGKREATIRVEQLSNELAKNRKVDILCAYPFSLHIQEDKHSFETICAEHSAVGSK
jgi:DNA-binding NarL/FixJ family response regulator